MSELVAGIIVLTVFLLINAVIAWFAHKAMKRFPWLLGWLGAVYALLIFMPVISGMFDLPTTTSDLIGAVLALVILGRAAVLAERLRERGERHWLLARLFRRRAQPKVPLARAKAQASRRVEDAAHQDSVNEDPLDLTNPQQMHRPSHRLFPVWLLNYVD